MDNKNTVFDNVLDDLIDEIMKLNYNERKELLESWRTYERMV